jgi:hypothetical protein
MLSLQILMLSPANAVVILADADVVPADAHGVQRMGLNIRGVT